MSPGLVRRRRALGGAVVGLGVLLAAAGPTAGAEPVTAARIDEDVHEVVPGDRLADIARRYGVTVAALAAANDLPSVDLIRIGQRLRIPRSPLALETPMGPPSPPRHRLRRVIPQPPNLSLRLPDFGDLLPLFIWPADGPVTSVFGRRRSDWHTGIDIRGDRGDPVAAAAPGVVIASGLESRYGYVVKIEHANGFVTVYAHNDRNLIRVGEWVLTGQTIAAIGRTGRATAHHLHFEIRHDGIAYNPLHMLPQPARLVVAGGRGPDEHEDDD